MLVLLANMIRIFVAYWSMPTIQLLSEAVTVNVLGNEAYETMDIINEHQIGISTIMATVKQKRNERWGILLY